MRADHLQISLLGTPEVVLGGTRLTKFGSRKAQALLFYIAFSEVPVSRDILAELLWSGMSEKRAKSNLRTVLSNLLRVVNDALIATSHDVTFNREKPYWLDIEELRSVARLGVTSSRKEDERQSRKEISEAAFGQTLALYRGPFLEGFSVRNASGFEEWLLLERERIAEVSAAGLMALGQRCLASAQYHFALSANERLLFLEPWSESAHQQQMRLLAQVGQRDSALVHYQTCQRLLMQELQVAPSEETTAIYEQIKNGALPLAAETARHTPLRIQPSAQSTSQQPVHQSGYPQKLYNVREQRARTLVGRATELALIQTIVLDAPSRVVTITGSMGMGKAKLARAVTEALLPHFADGVWVIALPSVDHREVNVFQLAETIADTIRVSFVDEQSVDGQLIEQMRGQNLLLVLLGTEHLSKSAVAFIERLLNSAPELRLITTAIAPLGLPRETIVPIAGLALPELPTHRLVADNQSFLQKNGQPAESVQLFIEAVRRVYPDFSLYTESDSTDFYATVTQLCHLSAGSPLWLEVAAGLVGASDIAAVVQGIKDILESGRGKERECSTRDALPTAEERMNAMLTYCWRQFHKSQQAVLLRLATFSGRFSLQAAFEVCLTPRTQLEQFVKLSLLKVDEHGYYWMHPAIRQYAAQNNANPTLMVDIRRDFCSFYANWLMQTVSRHDLPKQLVDAMVLEQQANVRLALYWAKEQKLRRAVERIRSAMRLFYQSRGDVRKEGNIE